MTTEWYFELMGEEVGPLTPGELLERVRLGQVKRDTLIRKDDAKWVEAKDVSGLFEAAFRRDKEQRSEYLCPFCGEPVSKPPTTCPTCDRPVSLALTARSQRNLLDRRDNKKAAPVDSEDDPEMDGPRSLASILKYAVPLLLWLTVPAIVPLTVRMAGEPTAGLYGTVIATTLAIVFVLSVGTYAVCSRYET